mmetsp:Transcript_24878/g.69342  ORF Transcript_24878/g.69342 Transcript_24878/m.69342 type:complete len:216 (-) Transcript_24878:100-747(-)
MFMSITIVINNANKTATWRILGFDMTYQIDRRRQQCSEHPHTLQTLSCPRFLHKAHLTDRRRAKFHPFTEDVVLAVIAVNLSWLRSICRQETWIHSTPQAWRPKVHHLRLILHTCNRSGKFVCIQTSVSSSVVGGCRGRFALVRLKHAEHDFCHLEPSRAKGRRFFRELPAADAVCPASVVAAQRPIPCHVGRWPVLLYETQRWSLLKIAESMDQ